MRKKDNELEKMIGLFKQGERLKIAYRKTFKKRNLTEEEMDCFHNACKSAVKGHIKHNAMRAEIMALLYCCQPDTLFFNRRYNDCVRHYATKVMKLTIANFCAYKSNLMFLYTHDVKFNELVNKTITTALQAVPTDKEINK